MHLSASLHIKVNAVFTYGASAAGGTTLRPESLRDLESLISKLVLDLVLLIMKAVEGKHFYNVVMSTTLVQWIPQTKQTHWYSLVTPNGIHL